MLYHIMMLGEASPGESSELRPGEAHAVRARSKGQPGAGPPGTSPFEGSLLGLLGACCRFPS